MVGWSLHSDAWSDTSTPKDFESLHVPMKSPHTYTYTIKHPKTHTIVWYVWSSLCILHACLCVYIWVTSHADTVCTLKHYIHAHVNKVTAQTFTHHIIVCLNSSFVFLCDCVSVCWLLWHMCMWWSGPIRVTSHHALHVHITTIQTAYYFCLTHITQWTYCTLKHIGCIELWVAIIIHRRYIDSMPSFYMHINAHITHSNTYNRQ